MESLGPLSNMQNLMMFGATAQQMERICAAVLSLKRQIDALALNLFFDIEDMRVIEWGKVESSNIEKIGYAPLEGNPSECVLYINFLRRAPLSAEINGDKPALLSGDIYRFRGVPTAMAEELYRAESVGGYFAKFIRPKWQGQKIQ